MHIARKMRMRTACPGEGKREEGQHSVEEHYPSPTILVRVHDNDRHEYRHIPIKKWSNYVPKMDNSYQVSIHFGAKCRLLCTVFKRFWDLKAAKKFDPKSLTYTKLSVWRQDECIIGGY